MRLLVTGSRGFIGGALGRAASARGDEVLGVGHASQPDPTWPARYVQADLAHTDLAAVMAEFAPDVVVHAAGPASVAGSFAAPLDDLAPSLPGPTPSTASVDRERPRSLYSCRALQCTGTRKPYRRMRSTPSGPSLPMDFTK